MAIRKVQWDLIRTTSHVATAEIDEDKFLAWAHESGHTYASLDEANADTVQFFLFETVLDGPEWVEDDGETVDIEHTNLEIL
jgi:hypothetical protein